MNNSLSLLLYLGVFLLSVLLYALSKKDSFSIIKQKVLFYSSICVIVVFAAMRNFVGTDYITYLNMLTSNKYSSFTTFFADYDTEIGFFIINSVGRAFGYIQITMAIASFITVFFYHLAMKNFKKESVVAYLIFLFTIFPVSLNLVRQSMAMSIVFYAISFLYLKDYKKFVIFVLVAATIHLTALFLLVLLILDFRLYFRKSRDVYKKYIVPVVFLFVCLILVVNFSYFIDIITKLPYLDHYSYLANVGDIGGNKDIALNAILLLSILVFSFNSYKDNLDVQVLIGFIVFAFIMSLTGLFNPDAKRIAMYIDPLYLVIIAFIIDSAEKKRFKYFFTYSFIVYAITRFIAVYYIMGNAEIFPYAIRWFIK